MAYITHHPIEERASADLSSHDGQIALAIQMRLDDLRSHESGTRLPGAESLLDRILDHAQKENVEITKLVSPTHLRRFLPKDLKGNEVRYADLDKVEPFLRSYLVRLTAVKTIFNLKGQLTEAEAKAAKQVYYEFTDPFGETIDLIPQFAIVHELAEREVNSRPVHDIDGYFAFAPWKSDSNRDLYLFALNQFKSIPPQLRLICPFIPKGTSKVNPVVIGAHAHLGMPYAMNYRTPVGSGNDPKQTAHKIILWDSPDLTTKLSPEESKQVCNWQVQLKEAMGGDFSPTVSEITLDNQESTNISALHAEESEEFND